MDNIAYLNKISQSNRTNPTDSTPRPKLPFAKLIIGGLVLFFAIMIFGIFLGSMKGKPQELTKQVYTRTTNLNTVISDNNRYVKSSRLRSISASLATVLGHASNQLKTYLTSQGSEEDDKKKDENALVPSSETYEEEVNLYNALDTSLKNARLNGILDRAYDNQITLQVSLLLSLVSELIARSSDDEELLAIINPFYSDLQNIHASLEAFSDPSN